MKQSVKKIGIFLFIPGIMYLVFVLFSPSVFGKLDTLTMLIEQSMVTCVIAWGMSFDMTAGNIDFSLGAEVIMGTLIGAMFAKQLGIAGIVGGALLTAAVCSLVKIAVISITKKPSMVISIAFTTIIGSMGAIITFGQSMVITSDQTVLGKNPCLTLIFLFMGAVMYFLQRYSVFGAHCRALGGNTQLAENAGIKRVNILGISIAIASVYCAVAAVLSLSIGAGATASTGLNSINTVFAAMIGVFIAEVLEQYINIVFGIFAGVLTMNIIGMGLMVMQIPTNLKDTFTGVFLLVLMGAANYKERRSAETMRRSARKIRSQV